MKKTNELQVKDLVYSELKGISGGSYYWLIPLAITIAYSEINDIWESGGQNLIDAWNSGYDAGYGDS